MRSVIFFGLPHWSSVSSTLQEFACAANILSSTTWAQAAFFGLPH
jgi:hypothetical protein